MYVSYGKNKKKVRFCFYIVQKSLWMLVTAPEELPGVHVLAHLPFRTKTRYDLATSVPEPRRHPSHWCQPVFV